ncbi:Hachiman antiphage defense system protein HamA [Pseudomonas aeruginosa]|uniref:Hachiman antiphage defense system protein HamA n=1 Tax=Pseudomonas aeruginosa TaxID=287 RepID=UPI0009380406|nr:Hachiman antiphage defense system protein HamA [Pseudomonas aeruginosa]MCT5519318.1 DUF1837 domain-containing protein [Pseudomonas aeruginosa]MEE2515673.1 SAVED domain-containing protein [Pseudomonas aeruginosa]HEJ1327453.1 DUF1837 domain-containing protein [Pseudomonas aeruginosa]
MPLSLSHMDWLVDTSQKLISACGKTIPVYKFDHEVMDSQIMSAWAQHFRRHYCSDQDLAYLITPGKTKSEYLLTEKFPDGSKSPGPSVRAGDFGEILIADYLEFYRNYKVPRTRYDRKIIANESSKGSDVLGFRWMPGVISPSDELLIVEVKVKATKSTDNTLQLAIDHSVKDETRLAESLNAMKQRLFDRQDYEGVALVKRFQNEPDQPYKRLYGAAAVLTHTSYHTSVISTSSTADHPNANDLELIVIHADELMPLIHALYGRAANEA